MRLLARRRIPRAVFDFIDGGSDDEITLNLNTDDFSRYQFKPRVLRDVSRINLTSQILGQNSSMPLVIAPTGLSGVAIPEAEKLLAGAAKQHNIPHALSVFGSCDLEEIAAIDVTQRWFQIYVLKNRQVTQDLITRANTSGYNTLVVTVDVPVAGKRERDWINGFTVPLQWSPRLCLDMLCHPRWSLQTLQAGVPTLRSLAPYAGMSSDSAQSHASWVNNTFDPSATWQDIEPIRQAWPGKLVIKGVMTCEDADQAIAVGADAIVVSNHGGRQIDGAASSVRALDSIAAHVDGRITLLMDSGIRRGSDIIKARCLGASTVMIGRPTLYGAAAGGQPGAERVLAILNDEMQRTLALLGVDDINKLDRTYLTTDTHQ